MSPYPIPGISDGQFSTAMISAAVGAAMSVLFELFPPLAAWWAGQPAANKVAYRGWFGLAVTVALVALRAADIAPELLGAAAVTPAFILAALLTWAGFVGGAEVTYRAHEDALPRKQ